MEPVKFDGADITYAENQPEYLPLPAKKVNDNTILTCWELSDQDIEMLKQTRKLWIGVMNFGLPLQPMLPSVNREDIDK